VAAAPGAATLAVNPAIQADPGLVAAAAATEGLTGGAVADAIALLGELSSGPSATWRAVVTDLGAQAQAAGRRSDLQAVAVREAALARQSVSGVDLDEELTRMVMFQRAFEGASRVMTAVDQALDVLINRTGVVGR
jgi:flagellar hook-associated protein 1 FlgK